MVREPWFDDLLTQVIHIEYSAILYIGSFRLFCTYFRSQVEHNFIELLCFQGIYHKNLQHGIRRIFI